MIDQSTGDRAFHVSNNEGQPRNGAAPVNLTGVANTYRLIGQHKEGYGVHAGPWIVSPMKYFGRAHAFQIGCDDEAIPPRDYGNLEAVVTTFGFQLPEEPQE